MILLRPEIPKKAGGEVPSAPQDRQLCGNYNWKTLEYVFVLYLDDTRERGGVSIIAASV